MPDTAADYSNLFFEIKGARAFLDWRASQLEAYAQRPAGEQSEAEARALLEEALAHFDATVGIEAIDDHTLRVTLELSDGVFHRPVLFRCLRAGVPAPLLEAHTRLDPRSGRQQVDYSWTKPPHIVTNGPYTPEVWKFKRVMVLGAQTRTSATRSWARAGRSRSCRSVI